MKIKGKLLTTLLIILLISTICIINSANRPINQKETAHHDNNIRWVDFDIPVDALYYTMQIDIASGGEVGWIELLSVAAVWYDGDWNRFLKSDIDRIHNLVKHDSAENASGSSNIYKYYYDAYYAVLAQWLGRWDSTEENGIVMPQYGLLVSAPISSEYYPSHEPDFGASRSYGSNRKHLGNDIMAEEGTPIVAMESGRIISLGWNEYGGWRVGIVSDDNKRYYYYAHMMKDTPYAAEIYEGKYVNAGEVIGYVGNTGYSKTENESNIEVPHLHIGLRLIFEENSTPEIWIDLYALTELLMRLDSNYYK